MEQSPDDIMIVSHAPLQALDLVNAVFLQPGDTVIVEAATYEGTLQRLQRLGVRYIGVPLDNEGIRMDALANPRRPESRGRDTKYIYTIPTVQNPTGSVMPNPGAWNSSPSPAPMASIFEDDCYAELTFGGARPKAIRALDTEGQVIYCGSFSKTIAPALRVGYLTAEWEVLSRLLAVKYDAGSGPSSR